MPTGDRTCGAHGGNMWLQLSLWSLLSERHLSASSFSYGTGALAGCSASAADHRAERAAVEAEDEVEEEVPQACGHRNHFSTAARTAVRTARCSA